MIIWLLSLCLDCLINSTFSLTFLIIGIYFNLNYKKILIIFLFFSLINGITYLPLLLMIMNYFFITKKKISLYLLRIILSLLFYNLFIYFTLSISDINLIISNLIITILMNTFYSLIIYFIVLKYLNNKYILV